VIGSTVACSPRRSTRRTKGIVPDALDQNAILRRAGPRRDPTFPGCVVRARPIGVFWMTEEEGRDAKISFVAVYKGLEPGKASAVGNLARARGGLARDHCCAGAIEMRVPRLVHGTGRGLDVTPGRGRGTCRRRQRGV